MGNAASKTKGQSSVEIAPSDSSRASAISTRAPPADDKNGGLEIVGDASTEVSESDEKERQTIGDISRCLKGLPVHPSLCADEVLLKKLHSSAKSVNVRASKDILLKNKQGKGIFIIKKGNAEVVSEHGDVSIATLSPGDYFGEVSTLYGIPCTARVRALSNCELLFLKKDVLTKATGKEVPVQMLDWFVTQRYMPTGGDFDRMRMLRRLCLTAIQNVSVFDKWTNSALKTLILSLDSDLLLLYPNKSTIMDLGDPSSFLYIVVRGRVAIYDGDEAVAEIDTTSEPVAFNEEGIRFDIDCCYRLQAVTCCQVIPIPLHDIVATIEKEATPKAKEPWRTREKLWKERVTVLRSDVYQKIPVTLQLEVLARQLQMTRRFSNIPFKALFEAALTASFERYAKGCLIETPKDAASADLVVVLEGCILVKSVEGESHRLQPPPALSVYDLATNRGDTLSAEIESLIAKIPRLDLAATNESE